MLKLFFFFLHLESCQSWRAAEMLFGITSTEGSLNLVAFNLLFQWQKNKNQQYVPLHWLNYNLAFSDGLMCVKYGPSVGIDRYYGTLVTLLVYNNYVSNEVNGVYYANQIKNITSCYYLKLPSNHFPSWFSLMYWWSDPFFSHCHIFILGPFLLHMD